MSATVVHTHAQVCPEASMSIENYAQSVIHFSIETAFETSGGGSRRFTSCPEVL